MEKIRAKLLAFINSDSDVPLLAGFSVGLYMLLFYYSRNFALANSWEQLLFFTGYYIVLPMVAFYTVYKLLQVFKLRIYQRHFLFIAILAFTGFFLLQINDISFSKKIAIAVIIVGAGLLSIPFHKYYKLLVLLLFLMAAVNIPYFVGSLWGGLMSSSEWRTQPDAIENVTFRLRPNIYYIQPDGYTSFNNLKDSIHNYDNTAYESFLKEKGFTLYEDYRSNYYSTLLSNSATFSMKHHYFEEDVVNYGARNIIIGDNPVLRILKKNNYKTHFITENPYLIINRPSNSYDTSNIGNDELPFLKDGFGIVKDVTADFKRQSAENSSQNFYFIERFMPSHIAVFPAYSKGVEAEKAAYLSRVTQANAWLKDMILFIERNDPEALIIIGADHGGFAGFKNTLQCEVKTNNPKLVNSIFGAHLAIKWPVATSSGYDDKLKTGVNLFRTVFSFLANDKRYLEHLQDDGSYIQLKDPKGDYRYIDDNGKVVFEKY
ncbi:MAG: hypothetical protein EOO45_03075 [Flavobacterium sp.]|nr:MAG: hypothetical protein EOO45_03075 [Flavobacterium sp.]